MTSEVRLGILISKGEVGVTVKGPSPHSGLARLAVALYAEMSEDRDWLKGRRDVLDSAYFGFASGVVGGLHARGMPDEELLAVYRVLTALHAMAKAGMDDALAEDEYRIIEEGEQ